MAALISHPPLDRHLLSVVAALLVASAVGLTACSREPHSASASFVPDTTPVHSPDNSVRRARADEISTGHAPLPSECEGSACREITVTWLDPGYRFENTSARPAHVLIWFLADKDCTRQVIALAPKGSSGWGNTGFCKPYRARFE